MPPDVSRARSTATRPPSGARCAAHTDAPAIDVCSRCGAFVCAQCEELSENEEVFCAACFAALRSDVPSMRAKVSAVLGWLGPLVLGSLVVLRPPYALASLLGAPLGLMGLAMATQERSAIERGDAKPAGKRWATVGLVGGVVTLVATVLLVGSTAYYLWFVRGRV